MKRLISTTNLKWSCSLYIASNCKQHRHMCLPLMTLIVVFLSMLVWCKAVGKTCWLSDAFDWKVNQQSSEIFSSSCSILLKQCYAGAFVKPTIPRSLGFEQFLLLLNSLVHQSKGQKETCHLGRTSQHLSFLCRLKLWNQCLCAAARLDQSTEDCWMTQMINRKVSLFYRTFFESIPPCALSVLLIRTRQGTLTGQYKLQDFSQWFCLKKASSCGNCSFRVQDIVVVLTRFHRSIPVWSWSIVLVV